MIELPKTKVKAETKSPKKLILFSQPKSGKTTLASMLDDNLIIDLEKGAGYIDALKIKVNNISELKEYAEAIKKENELVKGFAYRYGTIDTVTALEDMVMPLAVNMYKATPMGSKFTGDNVLVLPNGAGYLYVRNAFDLVISQLEDLFERVILLGHLKEKMITKDDKELESRALDLTGKLSSITCSKADAIGYLYRKGKETRVNFKSTEGIICGARPDHLKDADLVLGESDKDGKITSHWDRIFVD